MSEKKKGAFVIGRFLGFWRFGIVHPGF